MKILKIELQNINSLKSDTPIVIDFESNHFKDVGLYAITGSTGAGKTTILDAITIALYHNVPRFNKTSSKGALLDVVSIGANDAYCCITFENNHTIFEGYWGIRLTNKAGELLKNPIEKVSLKNVSTGKTLADQKRKYIEEVEKVTQLNYNQFLRSVMLAQGDFAAFLTAKGTEKGRLLEQITGEQIYKKIGQGILDRKSSEDGKLREIQSKINSDDVLTEEQKIELTQKDKELNAQIAASEKELEVIQNIANWYLKSKDLTKESETLERVSKDIDKEIENHKTEFQLLDLNEKAEPFKELIQNFNRNKKNTIEKHAQLKSLQEQIIQLKPQIESLQELSKTQFVASENADKELRSWLPKFETVTRLDSELKNKALNKQKSILEQNDLKSQIDRLQTEKKQVAQNLASTEEKIKTEEIYITKNNFLAEVDLQISQWTSGLTTLKGTKETLNEYSLFITQKNTEIKNIKVASKENEELLNKKLVEIEKIEKEILAIDEKLSKNKLTDLLTLKEKNSLAESKWKQFKNFSEIKLKEEKELDKLSTQKKSFFLNLAEVKKHIDLVKDQIARQEASVLDAEKILDLEKRIAKYEDDRKNLEKGQPCGLCGSKDHPFTENLQSNGISKSESELNSRRKIFNKLLDTKSELDKNEVKLTTNINSLTKQIDSINEELKSNASKASQLAIDCELTNSKKIDAELELLSDSLKLLSERINSSQKFQTKKDELLIAFKQQTLTIDQLKTKDATLNEKIKNKNSEVDSKQKATDSLRKICEDLEKDLKTKLSEFKYELPSTENTNFFLETIEAAILKFNTTQKNIETFKSEVKVLHSNHINTEKQITVHTKTLTEISKTIEKSTTELDGLKIERIRILPIATSVENKRKGLQLLSEQLAEKVEISKTALQKLLDSEIQKEALKIACNKELNNLTDELNDLNSLLLSELKESNFISREAIENALLTKEDKLTYTQNKERIKERQLKLKTRSELNSKAKEELNKTKNFTQTEEENHFLFNELKTKKENLLARKGEIKEAFRKDQEIKDRNRETYKKIEAQQVICNIWKELFKIIGNSKDAFNVYVQRLTLKHLLDLANVHLYQLNKRYSLKMEQEYKANDGLNFNLIDHYQTDQARLVDTSSGGEKFIISLALALGLSDLASKNVKIDSLFIDEGFGTLDSNTLETVISTLETLQSQGKMIGIISHVENLKERIPTQIQITKKSNGVSAVGIQ